MPGALAELVDEASSSGVLTLFDARVPQSPFTWADFDEVLVRHPESWHRADRRTRRQFSLAVNTALLAPETFVDDQGRWGGLRVRLASVKEAMRDGATLMINDLHVLVPSIGELAREATARLGSRVTVRAFASLSDRPGFHSHIDLTDTVVVQTAGRKRWRVWQPTGPPPVKNDVVRHDPPKGEPVWDAVLERGDVLFVPRGWWHLPVGTGQQSLHLSIDIHHVTRWDVLRGADLRDRTALSLHPSSPPAAGRGLIGWSDVECTVANGRAGSFFTDPRDGRFLSPVRAFCAGANGEAVELDPSGCFSADDAMTALHTGGMVRIAHAERFFNRVADHVKAIAERRGSRASADLVARGGPDGITLSGRPDEEIIVFQVDGCADWDVLSDSGGTTRLTPETLLEIPSGARYRSTLAADRSLHLEVYSEGATHATARRVRRAIEAAGLGSRRLPEREIDRSGWLDSLRAAVGREARLPEAVS